MRQRIAAVAFRLAGLVLLLAVSLGAASDWRVLRDLTQGQRIQVVRADLTSTRGRFESWSESSIVIRSAGGTVTAPKETVLRVSARPKRHRLKRILIGAAIGGGVGLLIGAVSEEADDNAVAGLGSLSGVFGAIGSGAAGAVGAIPRSKTLYRASKGTLPKRSAQ